MENSSKNKVFVSRFNNTRELTNGKKSEGILTLEPFEKGPPEHIHLKQMEYFEVISGELVVKVDGKSIKLKKGDRTDIKIAEKHTYFNETNEKVVAKFGYEPALNIQWLIDTMESGDKKNGGNWSKIPILETGFVLYYLKNEYRLAKLPFWLQDFLFGILSKLAKLTKTSDKIELPK
jgi:mannose-6-phosphate isomerase-like protein (cupin superfamily)